MLCRYKAGGVYNGEWLDGDKNGMHRFVQFDCLKFDSVRVLCMILMLFLVVLGQGVYTYASGDVYEGLFLHGETPAIFNILAMIRCHVRLLVFVYYTITYHLNRNICR